MGYEAFERLCKEHGVTPYRVAKETGVTTATLSSWKTGKYTPKSEKLQKLADYFGVNVDVFGDRDVQTLVQADTYYYNKETLEMAQELFKNKELRLLFDATKDIDSTDLYLVYDLVKRMKRTNRDE